MNAAIRKQTKREMHGGPKHRGGKREANPPALSAAAEKVHSDKLLTSPRLPGMLKLLHLPSAHRQDCLCHGTFSAKRSRARDHAEKISIRRLHLAELPADTVKLARFLIGKVVVHDLPAGRLSGRIVETEAYPPGDPAGHHYRGPTRRNRSLFLRHGHCYVYFTYGNHFMLNVSSEGADVGGGVLIRALEPLDGVAAMQRHRKTASLLDLTRGPGRLAAALRIDRRYDGLDLCRPGPLWLGAIDSPVAHPPPPIGKTVRIGITRAAHRLFRFYERGNPFVSGPKRLLQTNRQK